MSQADSLTAWRRLASSPKIGPGRLGQIATQLATSEFSIIDLVQDPARILRLLGFQDAFAEHIARNLPDEVESPRLPDQVVALTPDDEQYPAERLGGALTLPIPLYAAGNLSLLKVPGIAIAGSRNAHEDALRYAFALGQRAATAELNVVSGHAAGIDEAAHLGALSGGGTTTAVLAEGLATFKARSSLREADSDAILFVSGFEPDSGWIGFRAMERNSTIAALSDAVVVISANKKGGSWEQGKLCLSVGKPLFVVDLPEEIAPGNMELIKMGAIRVPPGEPDEVLALLKSPPSRETGEQLEFFKG